MANVPGWAWPEPDCRLVGSVLHVKQARWKQHNSFLPLVEPAKWMVVVYVGGTLVHGQVPNMAGTNTTAYADEMPLSTKTFSLDLAAYGVHDSHPLTPTVRVEQYAATKLTTGWQWSNVDWERHVAPLVIYIDSNAGVPKAATLPTDPGDPWMPLWRGFYDEGAEPVTDFVYFGIDNSALPFGAPNGSVGMQFLCRLPYITIDGIQVWFPPELWDEEFPPEGVTVRLWEGPATTADDNVVVEKSETLRPGWTNIFFDDPYPAKTQLIFDEAAPPTDPYNLVDNPDHDGWYVVGWESEGFYWRNDDELAYQPLYPDHDKAYVSDNYPSASQVINRFAPDAEKGPEWAPMFTSTRLLFVGPIMTYTPVYPVPAAFVPQVYRRVVTEAV